MSLNVELAQFRKLTQQSLKVTENFYLGEIIGARGGPIEFSK